MTAREFCYWLQGYFEIHGNQPEPPEPNNFGVITSEQAKTIRKHLALVFKYDIDPSQGPQKVQDALNHLHGPTKPGDPIIRC